MTAPDFPDQPPSGHNKLPATIENVEHLLRLADINVRYNVIKKRDEIAIPEHKGTSDNLDNVTLTNIVSMASKNGLPTGHISEYVQAIADRNAYNPVADWIKSKPWDGTDRVQAICETVVEADDYPAVLKIILIRKWLLSAVAAALVPTGFKCRGVLTLQGSQGIGKTSWVKSLVTDAKLRDDVVKLDHHLDAGNKDTILGAITNWIVEIGELESSFRKDIARLKGFLTTDADRVRRPYGRRESEYPRRTVFLATVNDANFLTDTTGNSRWWVIPVRELNYEHDIDMQQLFAQLADDLEKGSQWWLTDDEESRLDELNRGHLTISVIAEKLSEYVDPDGIDGPRVASLMASEMLELMGYKQPTNPQSRECGAALRAMFGEPKKIQGIYRWRVPLKEASADVWQTTGKLPIIEEKY